MRRERERIGREMGVYGEGDTKGKRLGERDKEK
jgi:hypothetical protein